MPLRRSSLGIFISIAVILLIEAMLTAADHGYINLISRRRVYEYTAFWTGLLHGWKPNFLAQPFTMFLTYPWVHSGITHALGNALGLAIFAPLVQDHFSGKKFFGLCVFTAIGGGLAFAVWAPGTRPMVGVSGVLYGLTAAWIFAESTSKTRIGSLTGLVMIGNWVSWWASSGQMAWQAHVGGFAAGAILALTYRSSFANTRS